MSPMLDNSVDVSSINPPDTIPIESTTEDSERKRRRQDHHESDVVVVGAGILGTSMAITLARQGRSVTLLERSLKEPDRIVGELLQPGGVAALEKLGLRDCLEEIDAVRVLGYEVIFYGEGVVVPYPANTLDSSKEENGHNGDEKNEKRPEGRSFHHGRFVRRLRDVAMKEPNLLVVETTATDLVKDGTTGQVLGVECSTDKEPDYYFGNLTIIADGYASKFRPSTNQPSSSSKFYALELHDAVLPSPNHGHVVLSAAPPTLLYQISSHSTRALIDVPATCPTASVKAGGVKNHLRNVILPALPPSVKPSFEAALDEGKLRSMPNSFLRPTTQTTPGLAILGDAMNMRHPLTGGGMTVALNDVLLLQDLLSPERVGDFSRTEDVLAQFRVFHWRRKGLTSVINILAMALYALFAADDDALRALQNGCFRYFQLGGNCVSGPVGLLAGLIRQPVVLFYHFFSVAIYGMYLFIVEGPKIHDQGRIGSTNGIARSQQDQLSHANGHFDNDIKQSMNKVSSQSSGHNGGKAMIPIRAVMSLGVLWKACCVLIPYILSELRF